MINIIYRIELYHGIAFSLPIILHQTQHPTMSVILILLLASISVAALFLGAFLWSVKTGQYIDQISPPLRILLETPISPEPTIQQEPLDSNNTLHHTQPTTKTTN